MQIGGRNYNVKAGFTVFLAITIVSAFVILYLDVDKNTWRSLGHIKLRYGLLAASLMLSHWFLNGWRFQILVNGLDENVSFWISLKGFLANLFMSAMTPSQTGGGPLQIYILNRAGVPIAKAFSGCLMGAVLTVFTLVTSTFGILVLKPGLRMEFGNHMNAVFSLASIIFLFPFTLFILSIVKIELVKRIVGRIILFLTRIIKVKRRITITKRVMNGLDQYSKCMSIYARAKKGTLIFAAFLNFASISMLSFLAPVLLTGLNVKYNLLSVFLTQFIIFFITYFSPTPGASGIAEFSSYWMLTSINIEQSMLGVYTVIWRFFTSFIGVGVGGLLVLTLFRKRETKTSDDDKG